MLPLKSIIIGKADAINYYKGEDKEFLQKIFFNDGHFNKITDRKIYFLLGDKGTGKTAYAVYTSNNESPNLKASLKFTTETDFKKFIRLISSGKINVSDFVNIWKVILLLLVSQEITTNIDENYLNKLILLNKINKAIKQYYKSAFSPEISNAIEIIDKAETFLKILEDLKISRQTTEKIDKVGFQVNLLEIENDFKNALKDIRLKKDFILFVDGTDQIPFDIKRDKYDECLRGLANAIWELNQFIFPEILPNEKNYIKIVLLIRPDIFSLIRFHNANAKLKDNSIILDWVTKSASWKHSKLFKLADNLFSSQQTNKYALGYSWANYCDENFEEIIGGKPIKTPSFVAILKRTFMRPRDIFAFLDIMHRQALETHSTKITNSIFFNSQAEFSRYLLGEIKDQFNFFHEDEEWQVLIDFFRYFDGKIKFDYNYFLEVYETFLEDFPTGNPDIFDSPDILLQELFSYNIICYIEDASDEGFFKWAYKEKTYTNLYPWVDLESSYQFHIGLLKALGLGRKVKRNR